MLIIKLRTALALLLLLVGTQVFCQQRYTNFPWTYDRTVSVGIGTEGTAFTFLGRLRPDTASAYTALAVPIAPIRSAVGTYYSQHAAKGRQIIDFGIGYKFYLKFTPTANLQLGVQQNWHRIADAPPGEGAHATKFTTYNSTDFSTLLWRDHLLFGASMENALHKVNRQYNLLLGFQELETYSWLRSSPFLLVQIRDDQEVPEFCFH